MISAIIEDMIAYNKGDARRIHHALKVYAFARTIAELEKIDSKTREVLEIAAVLHDIGIHNSEKKYGSCSGRYQEMEGPPVARTILEKYGLSQETVERVCFLIGHHHTYRNVEGEDYQILLESDFLVNCYEDQMIFEQVDAIRRNVFRTPTGLRFLEAMAPPEMDEDAD